MGTNSVANIIGLSSFIRLAVHGCMALPGCKIHNPIFNRFCMIHPPDGQTDRQTDGRAIAYAR